MPPLMSEMTKQSSTFIAPHKLSTNLCLADLQRYPVSEIQLGVSDQQVYNNNSWEMNNFRGFLTFLCNLKQFCRDVNSTCVHIVHIVNTDLFIFQLQFIIL